MDNNNLYNRDNHLEVRNEIKESRISSLLFLLLLAILIIALLIAILFFIKNSDMIGRDPLMFGMKQHNFTACTCIDTEGKWWDSTENGFVLNQPTPDVLWDKKN